MKADRLKSKKISISENLREEAIKFYTKYPNFKDTIDWLHYDKITEDDIRDTINFRKVSKTELKKLSKEDCKLLFQNDKEKNLKFKIHFENDDWLFVSPLTWESAIYMNSFKCGGGGAKWCIGDSEKRSIWYNYTINHNTRFVLAFNKNFKNFTKESEFKDSLKYMIAICNKAISVWNQEDNVCGVDSLSNFDISSKDILSFDYSDFNKMKDDRISWWDITPDGTVLITENIEQIDEEDLFYGQDKIRKVILPSGMHYLGTRAFKNCKNLEEVYIGEGLEEICNECFYGCGNLKIVKVPKSLKSIRYGAFSSCVNLEEINLSNVNLIEESAFQGCHKLKDITFSKELVHLGFDAFSDCSSLKSVDIPDSITELDGTFAGCRNLKKVKLPKNLKEIKSAFYYTDLESIDFPDSLENIYGFRSFCNCKLKSVKLPKSLKSLGWYTFEDNILLEKVILPKTITELSPGLFKNCRSLKEVYIPKSIKEISYTTFDKKYIDNLTIYYEGTEEDLNKIKYSVDDYYNDTSVSLKELKIICNSKF